MVIQVESDLGAPLAGARVLRDNREQGATADDGTLRLSLPGHEGDTAALRVACPADYTSPEGAIQVSLRSLAGSNTVPRYKALCPPLLRNLVVAVRTQHATGLPVTFRGRELARTDQSGTAHVLLRVPPKEQVALQLDTSADPALRPKSPELTIDMPAQDKIVLFDKSFTREHPPAPKVRKAPKPIGPTPVKVMSR
ncbi:MAG TPA: hypothetical protein VMF89_18655 [Polyangiales bacterium]|nr:hypothetical protein [Polyangiales bacterium]